MTTTQITETAAAEAAALRESANIHEAEAAASFERCDTDGFMSQWANGLGAAKDRMEADLVENGGRAIFDALFDLDGNLVAAKLIETQYGTAWGVLESDDPRSRIVKWVNRSYAQKAATRNRNMAKKGYSEGSVMAPAYVDYRGANVTSVRPCCIRKDGGFSRDVEIVTTVETGDWS